MLNIMFARIRVPVRGYRWHGEGDDRRLVYDVMQPATGKEEPLIIPADKTHPQRLGYITMKATGPIEERRYDPFKKYPALFLWFADLKATEDAILEFANKYGAYSGDATTGPNLTEWTEAITAMRLAIELWGSLADRDRKVMRQHCRWDAKGRFSWKGPLALRYFPGQPRDSWATPGVKDYRPRDLSQAARVLLDWNLAWRAGPHVSLIPIRLPDTSLTLGIEVHWLAQVMWRQLALAIVGDKQYRQCEYCGRQFELSPQLNRADRVFCKDSCRVTAYRIRKRKAVKLREEGKTLRQIAKEVNSDVPTVKKWIDGKGK